MSTVTVTDYKKRVNKEGKDFITLEIQGGLEFLQSSKNGQFYANVRKCSMLTNFTNEKVAELLIGTQVPGFIIKVETDPYEFTLSNGDVITLFHRWSYSPDGSLAAQTEPSF
jgi:hypothetical protein